MLRQKASDQVWCSTSPLHIDLADIEAVHFLHVGQLIAQITDFPHGVVVALAHAVKYLSDFGIADALFETKFFTKFGSRVHMLLTANTLTNLEIYRNDTDYSVKGSLISVLDRTKTKFGARLLRTWVGRPLTDKRWALS